LQLAAVAIPTLVIVVASILISRSILSAGDSRRDLEVIAAEVGDLRHTLQVEHTDYWRSRAERNGQASIPPGVRAAFLERTATFERIARSRQHVPEERVAIDEVRRALGDLAQVVTTGALSQSTDPLVIDRLTAQSSVAVTRIDRGLSRWVDVLNDEVRDAGIAADRIVSRLVVGLGLMIGVLMTVGTLMWLAVDRQRKRAVDQIADERDATRLVMASVQDGLAEVDDDGIVTNVNHRLQEIVGRRRDELVGRPVPWGGDIPAAFLGDMDLRLNGGASGVDRDVLLSVSSLASGAGTLHVVKDMTLRRQAEHQLRDLAAEREVLRRLATFVASGPEPEAVVRLVAAESARLLGGDAAVVRRLEHDHARSIEMGRWMAESVGDVPPPARIPIDGDDDLASALRGAGPCRITDAAGTEGAAAGKYAAAGYRSVAIAPIRSGESEWGTLEVLSVAPDGLAVDAETRLVRFAELVGVTVTNADARARLADQAGTDPLTGLANHRRFHERLRRQFDEARDGGGDLSIVMIDLDRFADVNATYGHQVGDEVLAEAARRLAAEARGGETIARIGGEEFAWILPGTNGLDAWRIAERGRRAIAETPFGLGVGTITASAGIADRSQAETPEDLLRLVEGALYWAKATGRNVTQRYSTDVVQELSVAERAERLARSQAVTALRALARAVDAKDPSTARHAARVATLSVAIAREMGWDEASLEALEEAALLHDVGKIGVPDALLLKPTRLTDEERTVVSAHAALGAEIVSDVLSEEQVAWVRSHHERWDGTGYPDGLAEEAIPEGARIIAVADAWDAMTSVRTYGRAQGDHVALDEIIRNAGGQFAPDAVRAFLRIHAIGEVPQVPPVVDSPSG